MEQQQKLSPEQQKQFDLAAKQAMEFITDKNVTQMIIRKSENGDPVGTAVELIVPLMQSIHAAAAKAGAKVETPILIAVSIHVLKSIAELLVMAQVMPESQVESFAKEVSQKAMQRHNSTVGGMA